MPLAYVLHFNMQENEKTEIISDVKTEIISASTMNAEISPSMDKLEDFLSIKSKVGDGGMGVVYLAKDIRLNRYVAIKRLKPQFLVDAQIRKRFLHEAKAVASLNNANIVHIYFIGEDNDGPYFVMEYIEGAVVDTEHPNQPNPPQTLEQYIATNGVMNIDEAVDFKFRVRTPMENKKVVVKLNGEVIRSVVKPHLLPAEMETITIKKELFTSTEGEIVIDVEDR